MKFTSQKIQDAFNLVEPALKNISLTQNTVSEEINDLEDFFKKNPLPLNFSYEISSTVVHGGVDTDDGVEEREFLIWRAEDKRLCYTINSYDFVINSITGDIHYNNEKEIFKLRPLGETAFEIRKRIYEHHLDKFLLEIFKKYSINNHDLKK
jgi:hypothetical protein